MKYTTGLPTPKFADLLIRLREEGIEGYPPSLGLRDSLRAALIYMRHNVIQAAIGEQLGVSQPTVSRAIGVMTEAIVRALKDMLLTAEEVPEGCDYVLDGTLFPCWSWRAHRELWSGKHRTTGMNASDPGPARRQARVSLGPLSGVHARRGRTGRLGVVGGNRPLRVDRRQGIRRKGNDHPAQEAPQR